MANVVSAFRISRKLMERLSALTEKLAAVDELAIIARVTRSVVMRMALLAGIKRLEKHYKLTGGMPAKASGESRGATRGRKPKPSEESWEHISVSMPAWVLDRAQRMAEQIDVDPKMPCAGHASRALVLRICMAFGAGVLERRHLDKSEWSGPFAGIEDFPPFATPTDETGGER